MPKKGPRIVADYLIPNLDAGTFGEHLEWVAKGEKIFRLVYKHKSCSNWTVDDAAVFVEWDRLKDPNRHRPDEHEYYTLARQRMKSAIHKLVQVGVLQRIVIGEKDSKDFKYYKVISEKTASNVKKKVKEKPSPVRKCNASTQCTTYKASRVISLDELCDNSSQCNTYNSGRVKSPDHSRDDGARCTTYKACRVKSLDVSSDDSSQCTTYETGLVKSPDNSCDDSNPCTTYKTGRVKSPDDARADVVRCTTFRTNHEESDGQLPEVKFVQPAVKHNGVAKFACRATSPKQSDNQLPEIKFTSPTVKHNGDTNVITSGTTSSQKSDSMYPGVKFMLPPAVHNGDANFTTCNKKSGKGFRNVHVLLPPAAKHNGEVAIATPENSNKNGPEFRKVHVVLPPASEHGKVRRTNRRKSGFQFRKVHVMLPPPDPMHNYANLSHRSSEVWDYETDMVFKTSTIGRTSRILPPVEKMFDCRFCSKTFRHRRSLNRHRKVHSSELLFLRNSGEETVTRKKKTKVRTSCLDDATPIGVDVLHDIFSVIF